MSHHSKSRSELNNEIAKLRSELKSLEGLRCHRPEDTLTLSILEKAPFTVWACRKNFEIVLWNKGCEERYACPKEQALGTNFFDRFVHEHERDRAKEDCLKIIADPKVVFVNFIADDHDASGKQMKMLTNCFRVWDERYKEFVQAEIGVDISALKTAEDEHRNIQELGMKIAADKFRMACQNLQIKLLNAHLDKTKFWQAKHDDALNLNRRYEALANEEGRQKIRQKVAEFASVRTELDTRFNALEEKIFNAKSLGDLEPLRKEVAEFVAWQLPQLVYE